MARSAKLALLLVVLCGLFGHPLHAENGDLQQRLALIDQQRDGLHTQSGQLEDDCLALLAEHSMPEDSGKVFAEIALIYAMNGMTEPGKTASYCESAVRCRLDAVTAAQMYVYWADALQVEWLGVPEGPSADARREIVSICLRGLREILDRNAPRFRQPIPVVSRFDSPGCPADGNVESLVARNQAEVAAREKVLEGNMLVAHRETLEQKCLSLYTGAPHLRTELEELARSILDDEEAVTNLMSRLR